MRFDFRGTEVAYLNMFNVCPLSSVFHNSTFSIIRGDVTAPKT